MFYNTAYVHRASFFTVSLCPGLKNSSYSESTPKSKYFCLQLRHWIGKMRAVDRYILMCMVSWGEKTSLEQNGFGPGVLSAPKNSKEYLNRLHQTTTEGQRQTNCSVMFDWQLWERIDRHTAWGSVGWLVCVEWIAVHPFYWIHMHIFYFVLKGMARLCQPRPSWIKPPTNVKVSGLTNT